MANKDRQLSFKMELDSKPYEKGLRDAGKESKKFNDGSTKGFDKTTEGIEKSGKKISGLRGRLKRLNEAFKKLQAKFKDLGEQFKKLKSNFKDLGRHLKDLRGNVNKVKKSISDLGGSFKKTRGDVTKLGKDFQKVKKNYETLSAGLKKFKGALGGKIAALVATIGVTYKWVSAVREGIKNVREFEAAISNINSLIDGPGGLTDATKKAIEQQSLLYGTTAIDNAKAYYDIISAGITDQTKALEVLDAANKAAIAGVSTTAEASNALLSVINAYGQENITASKASDVLLSVVKNGIITFSQLGNVIGRVASLANTMGVSVEELGASFAVLTSKKISPEVATTQINGLLTSIAKVSDVGKAKLKDLGVGWDQATIKTKGFAQAVTDLYEATIGSGKDVEFLRDIIPEQQALIGFVTMAKELKGGLDKIKASAGATAEALEDQKNTMLELNKATQAANMRWRKVGKHFEKWPIYLKKGSEWTAIATDKIIGFSKAVGNITLNPFKAVANSAIGLLNKLPTFKNNKIKGYKIKDVFGINKKDKEDKKEEAKTKEKTLKKEEAIADKKKAVVKQEQSILQKFPKVYDKIKDITHSLLKQMEKSMQKIYEQGEKTIQKMKEVFLSGGAVSGLGEVDKLLDDKHTKKIFDELLRKVGSKNLTPSSQLEIARVADELSNSGTSLKKDFDYILREVERVTDSIQSKDLAGYLAGAKSGVDQNSESFDRLLDIISDKEKDINKDIQNRILEVQEQTSEKIAEASQKIFDASAKDLKSTELLKNSADIFREVVDSFYDLDLTSDLRDAAREIGQTASEQIRKSTNESLRVLTKRIEDGQRNKTANRTALPTGTKTK